MENIKVIKKYVIVFHFNDGSERQAELTQQQYDELSAHLFEREFDGIYRIKNATGETLINLAQVYAIDFLTTSNKEEMR